MYCGLCPHLVEQPPERERVADRDCVFHKRVQVWPHTHTRTRTQRESTKNRSDNKRGVYMRCFTYQLFSTTYYSVIIGRAGWSRRRGRRQVPGTIFRADFSVLLEEPTATHTKSCRGQNRGEQSIPAGTFAAHNAAVEKQKSTASRTFSNKIVLG